jgi:pyrroline-5-carboxylate reductase
MKIGFIGTGNMGTAIIKGYLKANPGSEKHLFAYDKDQRKLEALTSELGIQGCENVGEVAKNSDLMILAVKPNGFKEAMEEIAPAIDAKATVIASIAAGVSINHIETLYAEGPTPAAEKNLSPCKVVRVMPNTPALVGQGMSALCRNSWVTDSEFQQVMLVFEAVGKAEEVDEILMDCVTGVSGSSPAYVYLFIEALADGAVAQGMNRNQAYTFAAQSVLGAAEMVLSTGIHPGALKDMVCSPGGTTIEAVQALEKNSFRNAVIEAVQAASAKSKAMSK